jgi:hypothetical protein
MSSEGGGGISVPLQGIAASHISGALFELYRAWIIPFGGRP